MHLAAVAGTFFALAACETPQGVRREIPAPTLQLLQSKPLALPATCMVDASVAVEFAVLADGQTADIRPIAAPECARTALAEWVASFRYAPPRQRIPSRVEWLVVAASRRS
jgi:hypothetical protein